ncbi:MAG: SAM-dependent methyltransferase [Legionellales bacterium]|nr:SAM-dependent methyltransferase [Legionellales bacterium]
MNDQKQAIAYANADFEEPHNNFIDLLKLSLGNNFEKRSNTIGIDLGTGAADIAIKLALKFPSIKIDAVDGSIAMLDEAKKAISRFGLSDRIYLINSPIQEISLAKKDYSIIFSNSLLHHLHDPFVLWKLIKNAKGNPKVFIMDLIRPKNSKQVEELTNQYAENEPEILRRDFKNSLKAAFTIDEVKLQLYDAELEKLSVRAVSDRHMVIS